MLVVILFVLLPRLEKALFSLFGLEKDDFLEVKEEDSFVLVFEKRELLEAHEKVLEKNKKDYWEIF